MGESVILISQHDSGRVPFILEEIFFLRHCIVMKLFQGPYLEPPSWKEGGTAPCSLLAFPWGAEGCISVKWPSTWKHYHHFACYLLISFCVDLGQENLAQYGSPTVWPLGFAFPVSMYGFTCLRMRLGRPVPYPVVPVELDSILKLSLKKYC